jgi:hypothetical protein
MQYLVLAQHRDFVVPKPLVDGLARDAKGFSGSVLRAVFF